jgi:hypothetical protein
MRIFLSLQAKTKIGHPPRGPQNLEAQVTHAHPVVSYENDIGRPEPERGLHEYWRRCIEPEGDKERVMGKDARALYR